MKIAHRLVHYTPPSKFRTILGTSLLLAGSFLAVDSSKAANYYWDGSTSTAWATVANWSTVPNATTPNPVTLPVATDDVFFSIDSINTATSVDVTGANNARVRSITFRGTNTASTTLLGTAARNIFIGAGGITMESGAGAATFGNGALALNLFLEGNQTWTQNSANNLTITNNVLVGHTSGSLSNVLTFSGTGAGSINVNANLVSGNATNANGYIRQTSTTVNSNGQLLIGLGSGSYGSYDLSGGQLTMTGTRAWIGTGGIAATSIGVMNVSGGNFSVGANTALGLQIVAANGGDLASTAGRGVLYATSGTVSSTNGIWIGARSGQAQMTIDNTAVVTTGSTIFVTGTTTSTGNITGVLNLNGGILHAGAIVKGTQGGTGVHTGIMNFNGGTLQADRDNATFLQGLTATYIRQDGATIDTNGHNVTVAQNLLAPTGSGISSVTVSGTGYSGSPYVEITGDGTGATAVANIDGSGNVTGITITSAGTGYTTATVTLVGGGGATIGSVTPSFAANTSGGLTKTGTGVLTLTGSNTYTGTTDVTAGTLIVGVSGTGSLAGAVTVATSGTLGGSGTINGAVTLNGTLAPGNSPGTLTINNSLTMGDNAVTIMELAGTAANLYDHVNVSGTLTLDGTIRVTLTGGFNPAFGDTFTLFSGWTGSIVDNGFVFDFSGAPLTGGMNWDTSNFLTTGAISAVPEPSTWLLLGLGALALSWRARSRRRA